MNAATPPPDAPVKTAVESSAGLVDSDLRRDAPVQHGAEADAPPPSVATTAGSGRGQSWLVGVALLLSLAFGAWGLWSRFAPAPDNAATRLREQTLQIDGLKQQTATLSRSDQISRDANRDLQGTLAERDEEIAGLRADVAFYERFVGATGQRRGLTVHELQLQTQGEQAWHFRATLTQNLNRGAVSAGRLGLAVEGTRDGKLQKLAWADLRQQPGAPGVDYSFKYFQQVEGDIVLPPGFMPTRVTVRVMPKDGSALEQSFAWAEAVATAAAN